MLIKHVVIKAPQQLQGALFNELKSRPLMIPISAKHLITKNFKDNAMLDALHGFEEKVISEFGLKYFKARKPNASRYHLTPYERLKEWETRLIKYRARWEVKAERTKAKAEKTSGADKKPYVGEIREPSKYHEKYSSTLEYFKEVYSGTPVKKLKNEPQEMVEKLSSLILEVEKPINSMFETVGEAQRLHTSLERLVSESNLHLFISIIEEKRYGYQKITVSTNICGMCKIDEKAIEAKIYDAVSINGYEPKISFTYQPSEYAKIPYLEVMAGGTNGIAHSMLRGIANVAEWVATGAEPAE